ncbi:MAG: hypothetical protein K2X77_07370 [Candidatus Obscuribacterales bacterium]|jgi:hypothetical protein|nr:hypothetical protein [Candidatus Obscuribacterales bacterium]
MKAIVASFILLLMATPCHAQILQNLAKEFIGGQTSASPSNPTQGASPSNPTQGFSPSNPTTQYQVAPMVTPPPMQLSTPDLSTAQGVLTGTTALPPGYYSITNMQTGQAFYLSVAPGGQTFAIDPRTVQGFNTAQQQVPQQPQEPVDAQAQAPAQPTMTQQAMSKVGAAAKSTLTNYLQNKLAPTVIPTGAAAPQ